jgi:hypothetical protein
VSARGGLLAVKYLVDGHDDRAGHAVYCRGGGLAGLPSRPAVCTAESPASTRGLHRALLGGGPDLFGVGAGGRVVGGALHDENGVVQGDPEQVVEVVRHAPGRLPRLCSRSDWRSRLPGGLLFGPGLFAAGEVPQARGEHRGPRQRDLDDGKLDGEARCRRRAPRSAPDAAPARSLAGCQVVVQPGVMRLAQRRGDDEPGQRLAHRLVAVVPETRSAAGLNSTTRPWWSMVIQQSSADSKIAGLRSSRAIAPACQTQRCGPG